MKSTPSPRFTIRLFLLTLVCSIAVAVLLGVVVSARRASRDARARVEAANLKSGINVAQNSSDKATPLAPSVATITATLTDNTAAATKVAPGGTINYTAVITNSGVNSPADDATNLNFSAPLDANTTLVAGSVHASPLALNDTYNWVGNTFLDTSARALPAVTANDIAVNAPGGTDTFTLTAIGGGATALGGVVTLASPSGHFSYTPPLGRPNAVDPATVQDSFTYTITNNADPTLTSTGTVRINLTGRVWYLVSGGVGDGRSNTPSGSPSAMSTAADKSTDIFYIFSNASSISGPFTVEAGQQLLGQGVNLVVNAITLFTATAPTPTTINAGSCVSLTGAPGNNTLSGFNIGNCTGGTAITGANVGTLAVSTLSINTNGGGLDLTGSGSPTVSIVLGGLTSTGGTKNVNLVGLNGTITLASGALSGASGNAFDVSGAASTITYSGTITNTAAARLVNVSNRTGGSITLSGNLSGTGSSTGINLNNNTGGTVDFSGGTKTLTTAGNTAVTMTTNTGSTTNFSGGGLAITTTTGGGFSATGGGTINVTTGANNNTISSGTGIGFNANGVTFGGSGVTFRSISSSGGTNGILLNTTTGNFTVAGDGTGLANGSGGTIQNITGGALGNAPVYMLTVNGTITLRSINMSLNTNCFSGMLVDNNAGGTLTVNITGSTFTGVTASIVQNKSLLQFEAGGAANLTANVQNCFFNSSRTYGMFVTGAGTSVVHATLNQSGFGTDVNAGAAVNQPGTTITNPPAFGLGITNGSSANVHYTVTNNTFWGASGLLGAVYAVTISGASTTAASSLQGSFNSNKIGKTGTVGSGCSNNCAGLGLLPGTGGLFNAAVNGNDIRQVNNRGIDLFNSVTGATSTAIAHITNNTLLEADTTGAPLFQRAISISTGNSGGSAMNSCIEITGNNMSPGGWQAANFVRITTANTTGVMVIPGLSPVAGATTAQINAYIQGLNTLPAASVNTTIGGAINGGAACAAPTAVSPIDPVSSRGDQGTMNIARTSARENFASPQSELLASAATKPATSSARTGNRNDSQIFHHARTRRLPLASKENVSGGLGKPADAVVGQQPLAPTAGENVQLNTIATFPAARSITIKYSATVNTTVLTARQATTQGTITANGGAINVTTTDPGPPVVAGPTVTLLDTTLTWTGATNTDWNTVTNWNQPGPVVSSYAPGVSNPAVNDVIIPAVATQPTISATDIGIYSLSLANTMTLTITNPRVLTIGGSPGGDLTLNGIISGGFLNFGTGTHNLNNAGGTGSLSSTNVATVISGSTVTLNNNLQAGAFAVNGGGTFNITNRTLSLNGSGAALALGGTFTTTGSTVVLNGTAAQTIAGTIFNNLTINNTIGAHVTGVTLVGASATVNGVLTLTSSDLATGAFTLTMPVAATSAPATGASDVVGNVTRTGFVSGGAALSFGNALNTIRINSGTAPTSINVLLAKNAPATYQAAVLRSYTITPTGGSGITATVRLHYRDADLINPLVSGGVISETPDADFNFRRFTGGGWKAVIPTSRNTAVVEDNWLENNAVTTFSEWTFANLAPTASSGVVTGRIVDDNGNPIEGAVVRLNGTQNRKFITDANGYYRFDNVETNGFYTVTPSRANYSFTPSVRSFSQIGESTEATFGATLTTSTLANPLDTPEYFVRQHYVDFLNREPDEAGFNFWSDQIIECGTDQNCIERRRENVSAAYFLSIEFQRTGGLVDGLYRAAYGDRPDFAHFLPDTRIIGQGVQVGKDGWETLLATNTDAFVNSFVNRAEFHAAYDNLSDSQYVDTLISHTGVSFTAAERDALLSGLGAGSMTRAQALRSISENGQVVSAKFNETFVMMEYFGYLRRDPDASGFAFWLNKLNQFNGNFEQAEMVKAFIVSTEYRDRFPR